MAKAASGGAFANMNSSDKKKLILASAVLVIALIWIFIYAFGGGPAKPATDPAVMEQIVEETKAEQQKIEKQQKEVLGRGGRPIPPTSGS